MLDEDLNQFATDFDQEILAAAEAEDNESFRAEAFTRQVIADLTDAGELDDGEVCFHEATGVAVSGYGLSADELTLNLFTTIYKQAVPPVTVGKSEVDASFRRLSSFLQKALAGYSSKLEEASPAFDMAQRIYELRDSVASFRLFLFTDGVTTLDAIPGDEIAGNMSTYHLWDIRRLFRCVTSGQHREAIEIDFEKDFGQAIPCLRAPRSGNDEYTAYLAIFPGNVLSAIYERYGPRLLELNVRSFLQARGKVNQGIRRTLLSEPQRFLAYNNGISVTASRIQETTLADGGIGIRSVSDFQIANGGQTTASIYQGVRKDQANVSDVFVPAKLTVIAHGDLGEFVPLVARFANSQNTVREADFSANDPFHVDLEKLSRSIWAPATDGTQRQTKWFYERARGQYQDALGREGTPGRQRQWKSLNPPQQKFTKTDLAKFENTWDQLPQLVSLGAEKNFREFTLRLAKRRGFAVDQLYFRRLVGKAILFKRAERIVSGENLGGYRANIVTYALAKISHATSQRLDLDAIWRRQDISSPLADAIAVIARGVNTVITNPPGGRNVTEWCKRLDCWERVRELSIELPIALGAELVDIGRPGSERQSIDGPDGAELELIRRVSTVGGETWFEISRWASQTQNLAGWQRSIAFGLGKLAKQSRTPSRKQAAQGVLILQDAGRKGFQPTDDPSWQHIDEWAADLDAAPPYGVE